MLFGDRCKKGDLRVTSSPVPVATGQGLARVHHIADCASILLIDP